MKKAVTLCTAALLIVLALSWSAVAGARDVCDTGLEYAQEHIVTLAQTGALGTDHIPGEHQGFAGIGETPAC
jgi:hypothetical protein